jgi:thioredoxin reductase
MYRLLDADSYRGKHLLVVGGGDSAVEAAIGLARHSSNTVTLSYRREKLVRIKKKNEERLAPLLRAGKIKPIFGSQVKEIREDAVTLAVDTETLELRNDYVFVFAGGEPPYAFLRAAGVSFGDPAVGPAVAGTEARAG